MNRSKIIAILALVLLFAFVVVVRLYTPKPLIWSPSFDPEDTQPYDTYVFDALLSDFFEGQPIHHNRLTLYELLQSQGPYSNIISLSRQLYASEGDWDQLLSWVDDGGHALLMAEDFDEDILDRFGLNINDHSLFYGATPTGRKLLESDTIRVGLPNGSDTTWYPYPLRIFGFSFTHHGTGLFGNSLKPQQNSALSYEVLAVNDRGEPVAIRHQTGKGTLVLATVPYTFTNFFLLETPNEDFASTLLDQLQGVGPIEWTEYYHLGREESTDTTRFIASQPALRWGYNLLVIGAFIFVLIHIKRRQRIIPVIKPPRNDTLDFVTTIGQLYHERKDHADLATKRIRYWQDYVRQHYQLSSAQLDKAFAERLAHKSQKEFDEVEELVSMASAVLKQQNVSAQGLKNLNKALEKFYK